MVRGFDNNGCLLLAFTRQEMERLIAGERICSDPLPGHAPGPHLCLFGGETDEECLARMDKAYPIGTPVEPIHAGPVPWVK
jgi:hypothetical protein